MDTLTESEVLTYSQAEAEKIVPAPDPDVTRLGELRLILGDLSAEINILGPRLNALQSQYSKHLVERQEVLERMSARGVEAQLYGVTA